MSITNRIFENHGMLTLRDISSLLGLPARHTSRMIITYPKSTQPHFDSLPRDLILKILSELDLKSLDRFFLVNKNWIRLCENFDELWKDHLVIQKEEVIREIAQERHPEASSKQLRRIRYRIKTTFDRKLKSLEEEAISNKKRSDAMQRWLTEEKNKAIHSRPLTTELEMVPVEYYYPIQWYSKGS